MPSFYARASTSIDNLMRQPCWGLTPSTSAVHAVPLRGALDVESQRPKDGGVVSGEAECLVARGAQPAARPARGVVLIEADRALNATRLAFPVDWYWRDRQEVDALLQPVAALLAPPCAGMTAPACLAAPTASLMGKGGVRLVQPAPVADQGIFSDLPRRPARSARAVL